jgi:hypothetical protein
MLTAFKLQGGNRKYLSNVDALGMITVKDITGTTYNLQCLKSTTAVETLGVFIAADGNWTRQVESISKPTIWAD